MTDIDELKKLIDRVAGNAERLRLHPYLHSAWGDFDAACIAYLTARNLRVIDPAKCMVLERRESVPEEGLPSGRYLMIENEFGDMVVTNKTRAQVYVNEISAVAFGPIQLPATEAR